MAQFLIFDLYGPLASWGEIAVGEVRGSADHPTRSALLGLVASALGISRSDEAGQQKLSKNYRFGVRLDAPGEALRDYHTVQFPTGKGARGLITRADELRYERRSAMLTSRDYRVDAHYTICLWSTSDQPPWSLNDLAQALKKPAFPMFLGRKSCPLALPLRPEILDADSLLDALSQRALPPTLSPLAATGFARPNDTARLYWRPDGAAINVGVEPAQLSERWDEPTSRARWQFARRDEAMAHIPRAKFKEDV